MLFELGVVLALLSAVGPAEIELGLLMQQKLPRQEGRDDARHGLLLDRMRALALAFIPAKSVLNMSKNFTLSQRRWERKATNPGSRDRSLVMCS